MVLESVRVICMSEWVFNKAAVHRELSNIVKARKLAYYGHSTRKQGL